MRSRGRIIRCLWFITCAIAGLLISCLTAVIPQFFSPTTAVRPIDRTRVWQYNETEIGVLRNHHVPWWFATCIEYAEHSEGKIVPISTTDTLSTMGKKSLAVQFSFWREEPLLITPQDVMPSAPNWYQRSLKLLPNYPMFSHGSHRFSSGWPARCLEGISVSGICSNCPGDGSFNVSKGFFSIALDNSSQVLIPYLPIPHALLINSLFWGTLFAGFIWLCRRIIRRLLNVLRPDSTFCHHCRYPRTGLRPNDPCPECGQAPTPLAPSISA